MGLAQVFLILLLCVYTAAEPIVNTKLGRIQGVEKKFEGEKVAAYLGVPYARSPAGNQRFKISQIRTDPWDKGTLIANELAKSCIQTPDEAYPGFWGSEMWNSPTKLTEDCLNMNIWVPESKTGHVIVWIFGGGFFSGSPSLSVYDGTALAAKTGAIVVNINYRVGPFGFLYFGDESSAPGNMGLLDQQVALQWIHEHINSFGGDPSKVTLFGESAGAASVSAHLAAPGSHKYFHKIILNSGSIAHIWASESKERILSLSQQLAERVNCPTSSGNTEAILECMRKVSADELQTQAGYLWPSDILSFPFVPIREDKHFFQGSWYDRFVQGRVKKDVSVIIGEVTDEGTFWLPYNFADYGFTFDSKIPADDQRNAALINSKQYHGAFHALMTYFKNSSKAEYILSKGYRRASSRYNAAKQRRDGVAQFVSDFFFACGVREFADLLYQTVTRSIFKSSANPWPKWMGVMHGYEIEYEFGQPLLNSTAYDKVYSHSPNKSLWWTYTRPTNFIYAVHNTEIGRRPINQLLSSGRSFGLLPTSKLQDDKTTRYNLVLYNSLNREKAFSEFIMQLIKDFITTGTPHREWPNYDTQKRKSLELGKDSMFERTVLKNVRGKFCELINTAKKAAAKQ